MLAFCNMQRATGLFFWCCLFWDGGWILGVSGYCPYRTIRRVALGLRDAAWAVACVVKQWVFG